MDKNKKESTENKDGHVNVAINQEIEKKGVYLKEYY